MNWRLMCRPLIQIVPMYASFVSKKNHIQIQGRGRFIIDKFKKAATNNRRVPALNDVPELSLLPRPPLLVFYSSFEMTQTITLVFAESR